jgi:hypothetical protein
MNLVFDLIILCLGVFAYIKMKKKQAMGACIGIGFGFFAISYILTILGYGSLNIVLIPLRVLGYLSVIAGLYMYLIKR